DFGGRALEYIRTPEMKRDGRQLKPDADQEEKRSEHQHSVDGPRAGHVLECHDVGLRKLRQIGCAELAGQQANAVYHDTRGTAAVDHVLERRLAALPPAFEKPR